MPLKTIIIILFFCVSMFAREIEFRHLTVEDGLSQNTINCIFQDSRGFLWFGTQDGLNRYDGYTFSILRHEAADATTLSHSWIWDVFEDSRNNIWVATWNGLNRFDAERNKFIRYLPDSEDSLAISGSRPTSICEDDEGFIWIGTWGGGLNRYDYETDRFKVFLHDSGNENSLPNNFIRKLFITAQGELWIGTWNGLSCLTQDGEEDYRFRNFRHNADDSSSLSENRINAIIEDKQGLLWIGTFGGGLNQFDPVSGQFVRYGHIPSDPHSLSSDDVSALYEDQKGRLWIGTVDAGINQFDRENKQFMRIKHNPENKSSLKGNNAISIYEDQSGLLWIGANGLNIYNSKLEKFKHYHSNPLNPGSLSHNNVTAIYEDVHGVLWIGSGGGGLNQYDRRTDQFIHFKQESVNPFALTSDNVSSITGIEENTLWIGTRGGGVNRLDVRTDKFYPLLLDSDIPRARLMPYVNALAMDHSGSLWIGTYDNGLIRYNPDTKEYDHFISKPEDKSTIGGNYILRVYVDSENNVWSGIWGGGLSRYNRESGTFTRYNHNPNEPTSLGDNIVHSIYESHRDGKRILWVGTGGGLSYADLSQPEPLPFAHLSQRDGLPSNVVYGILEDPSGKLWLSTNNGISCFNPADQTFTNFDVRDGLQSNEFNSGAHLITSGGQFLFGGINGFTAFFPDSIKQSDFQPPIGFTTFRIFDKPVLSGIALNAAEQMELDYKQNFFSFEFSALDFTAPEKNQYAYILEGFDAEWIYSGTRRYASYTNLDPGHYSFRVKGSNSDGMFSKNEAAIRIIIHPPYWQRWWFRLLGIMLVLGILYGLYRFRVSKLLEIERMRIRIASDLHDDIGSTLTKIAINSEIIQSTKSADKIRISSQKIGQMSREIISAMSDIIWSIDARNDTFKDLVDRMRDFSSAAFAEKNIKLHFTGTGLTLNKKIPSYFRQNMFLIFKETIHNILKHAQASEVRIDFSASAGKYRLCVKDNGKGMDEKQIHRGNGIKNMKLRAQRIHAMIEIHSQEGTDVCLSGKLP